MLSSCTWYIKTSPRIKHTRVSRRTILSLDKLGKANILHPEKSSRLSCIPEMLYKMWFPRKNACLHHNVFEMVDRCKSFPRQGRNFFQNFHLSRETTKQPTWSFKVTWSKDHCVCFMWSSVMNLNDFAQQTRFFRALHTNEIGIRIYTTKRNKKFKARRQKQKQGCRIKIESPCHLNRKETLHARMLQKNKTYVGVVLEILSINAPVARLAWEPPTQAAGFTLAPGAAWNV